MKKPENISDVFLISYFFGRKQVETIYIKNHFEANSQFIIYNKGKDLGRLIWGRAQNFPKNYRFKSSFLFESCFCFGMAKKMLIFDKIENWLVISAQIFCLFSRCIESFVFIHSYLRIQIQNKSYFYHSKFKV